MPYNYVDEKPRIFTEENQILFLTIRDKAKKLIKTSGAVMMENLMTGVGGGDSWVMLACVDRLIELGELREITGSNVAGQHRIFVAGEKWAE
jgi:hypothetical protein